LRIFVVTQKTPNELALPASSLWEANLQWPLQDLGHQLIKFDHPWLSSGYDFDPTDSEQLPIINASRPEFCESLLDAIKREHQRQPIDLFFSYFTGAHVDSATISAIKSLGIPTINWFCNASYQFHLVKEIAAAFDYCLVPEKFRLDDYRQVGATPIYSQEAANPTVYKWDKKPPKYDVTFVGQRYGSRPEFVNQLHGHGVDVRVWGPYWQQEASKTPTLSNWKKIKNWVRRKPVPHQLPLAQCGPALSDDALIRLYGESKISLGFSTVAEIPTDGSIPIKQVRLRDFEATMSGAFYMVEAFDELAEFFEPDKEIVFFNDKEELVDKVKFYLKHSTERERIRAAGYKRAQRDHTWQNRFSHLFEKIGLTSEATKCAG